MVSNGHPIVHFLCGSWYSGAMDSGWTEGNPDVSNPDKVMLIKSKRPVKGVTFGTVTYAYEPTNDGFWFLCVPALRLYLTGKW